MTAGIDIGGTKIRWVILDKRSRVIAAREIPTPPSKNSFITFLRETLNELKKRGITRFGFGVPGTVSGNTLVSARNLRTLVPVNFQNIVPSGMALRVDNDGRCFARSEAMLGRGKRSRGMFAITLGTGIGRSFIKNGKVIVIKRFTHSEPWEDEYKERSRQPAQKLAPFLAKELLSLIAEFQPNSIVFGGGRLRTPQLFEQLKRELRRRGVRCPIYRSHFRQNSAAIGAALLF